MIRRRAAASLLSLTLATPAAALDPRRAVTQYRHDAWHTADGLPQSSVEAILQSRDGYLWLGTQEGLVRFDGVRFTVFDKSNTRALRHNRILALAEDGGGSLWIGTEGGGLTRLREGAFKTFRTADGLPNDRVRAIAADRAGVLWIGTDAGLTAWNQEHAAGAVLLPGEPVRVLLGAPDGSLWIGTSRELLRMRPGSQPERVDVPGTGGVLALWIDADGTVWVGRSDALVRIGGGEIRSYTVRDGLPGPGVRALCRDRSGSLWVGTEGAGLTRMRGERFESFTTREGLSNNLVLQIYEDREGYLWIGMQDGGLNRLADGRFTTWTTREGLAGDIVWPVFGDRAGNVWVGTSTGGLSRLRDGRIRNFTTRDGLSSNAVQALAEDADGALWIGTRRGGLDRLKHGRITRVTTREGLPGDSVSALHADRRGGLWIGMRGSGLAHLAGGRIRVFGPRDGLPNDTLHFIHEDRSGVLWLATNGSGLVRFEGGAFRAFTVKDGLSADIVNTVHEDADGTLWIGTYGGGLNRMRDGRISAYTTAEGLYDDAIFQILEDGRGNLWMSCNKGIFRVAKAVLDAFDHGERTDIESVAYGTRDGMKNRECNGANQPAGWRTADGRLWFPTIEGLVEIDPDHLAANPSPPPVVIEKLVVDGTPVAPRDGLELRPGTDSLEFQYAGLSFGAPERMRFRYMLEGFDRDWVEAGTRRVAYYTRVPAGRYRFRVVAANEDGVWNESGSLLSLRVRPHFYRTPAFYALFAASALATSVAGYRLRIRRLRSREQTLVRLVEQRTRELEEANRRLERLSSLDGLTGVANRRRFDEALDVEWRRGCRSGSPLSLALLDVDGFKAFNDTYGHLRGDECLQQVALALSASLGRAGDLLARYGGEEFVALLPHTGAEDAARIGEKLRAQVEALAIPHEASTVSETVTASVGVATTLATEDGDPATLLASADRALYQAKRAGRNRSIADSG